MNFKPKKMFALLAAFALAGSIPVMAQSDQSVDLDPDRQVNSDLAPSLPGGPHGGAIRQTNGIQMETVVTHGGIRLFAYDQSGKAVSVDEGRGVASLRIEGNAKRYRYDLLPDGKGALTARVNLSKFAGRQVDIDFRLVDVSGAVGRVAFQEIASVPRSESQLATAVITVTTSAKADFALIRKQAKCPVMDESLGSMGKPVKVLVGDKPIFLCCKGCVKKIEADPKKYFAIVYGNSVHTQTAEVAEASVVPANGQQVRDGVFKVTAADRPFIAVQKRCPVMDEPLDAMGGPFRVNADGKAIYICCPGCEKKIAAAPKEYLDVLVQQGVNAPKLR